MNIPKLGQSSVNPDKWALTVKGAIPLIVAIALYWGVNLEAQSLIQILDQLVIVVSGVITLVGLGRKVWVRVKST